MLGTKIGGLVLFQMGPDVLGPNSVWSIGGKELQPEASTLLAYKIPNRLR